MKNNPVKLQTYTEPMFDGVVMSAQVDYNKLFSQEIFVEYFTKELVSEFAKKFMEECFDRVREELEEKIV